MEKKIIGWEGKEKDVQYVFQLLFNYISVSLSIDAEQLSYCGTFTTSENVLQCFSYFLNLSDRPIRIH